jgi:hypothetical protein
MSDTIDLGDGWEADRIPWEAMENLLLRLFPDRPEDDGDENQLRKDVRDELKRKGSAYWLGRARNLPHNDLLKLKQCDEMLGRCKLRRGE